MDNKYKNLKKTFNICAILQCLYCLGCIIGMIGWHFYCAFYPSEFAELCFRIGITMNIYSSLSPVGLISWMLILVVFCGGRSLVENKRIKTCMIVWLAASFVITVLCWLGAVKTFMIQVSGV